MKEGEEIRWRFLSVDSLLLFAFASLSARPFQTPASRSPGGTPPSSASRAGTPRSCHTCGGKDTHDISVLARPFKFTLAVDACEEQFPAVAEDYCFLTTDGCKGKERDMLIRRLFAVAMITEPAGWTRGSAGERRGWGARQLQLSAQLHMSLLSA